MTKHLFTRRIFLFSIAVIILFFGCKNYDSTTIDLNDFGKKVYSQNNEDGIIEKIFEIIGTTNKYYVEFGTGDGSECNSRYLREKKGFSGLMMNGCCEKLNINLRKEFITRENINLLFKKYKVPTEFDILSIDIDYNDFYIWQALTMYKPRLVVIEHNSGYGPNDDKVVLYNKTHMWDYTDYSGASIVAMNNLGKKLGYTLLYSNGVNLFFLRDDTFKLLKVSFIEAGNPQGIYKNINNPQLEKAIKLIRKDPYNRPFISSLLLLKD